MSEGQETSGILPVNEQEAIGQCIGVEEPKLSEQNPKRIEFESQKDEQKVPVKKDGKNEDNAGPDDEPGEMAEGLSKELDKQASDADIDMEGDGIDAEDDLPPLWIKFKHTSNVQIYMHKPTQVCTLSKPYVIPITQDISESPMPYVDYAFEGKEMRSGIGKCVCEATRKYLASTDTTNVTTTKEETKVNIDDAAQVKPVAIKNKDRLNIDWSEIISAIDECSLYNLNDRFDNFDDLVVFANSLPAQDAIEIEYGDEFAIRPSSENKRKRNRPELSIFSHQTLFVSDNLAKASEDYSGNYRDNQLIAKQIAEYCKENFNFKMPRQELDYNWGVDIGNDMKGEVPSMPAREAQSSQTPARQEDNEYKDLMEKTMLDANETSFMSMFHEYVYKEHLQNPIYVYKNIFAKRGDWCSSQATVYINKKKYGMGQGLNKPQARYTAARVSLSMLMHGEECAECPDAFIAADAVYFDYVAIDDPCVLEFCLSSINVTPYALLLHRLRANKNNNEDSEEQTRVLRAEPGKIVLKMKAENITTVVTCQNMHIATHRASQNILQELHPEIRSWGSLIRWYSIKGMEKKLEELQASKHANGRYKPYIDEIRKEMLRLRKREEVTANVIMMRTGRSVNFPINDNLDA